MAETSPKRILEALPARGAGRVAAKGGIMRGFTQQRAQWLAQQVLPHEPALRAWLRRYVRELADVDDVVQESYALLAALDSTVHIQDARSYLFTTAKSVILQGLRRARVVSIETVGDIERLGLHEEALSPERHFSAVQELRRISQHVARLPGKCGEAFMLRKVQGLAQREIAARMGISENTVEKHIGKALRLLGEALAEDRPGHDARAARPEWEKGENHEEQH